MKNLISVNKLIKEAKKSGVNFGKGDPYNRLRYYTKIGWLPHMLRKREGHKNITGHYPTWALDRLLHIEELKEKKLSNEEITKVINRQNKTESIKDVIKSPEIRTKILAYLSFAILLLILASETGLMNLGKSKSLYVTQHSNVLPNIILESGTAFVPRNQHEVFVKAANMANTYKVYVSFNGNFSPAVRFWVDEKKPFEGFKVRLDAPVAKDVEFNWWVTN